MNSGIYLGKEGGRFCRFSQKLTKILLTYNMKIVILAHVKILFYERSAFT